MALYSDKSSKAPFRLPLQWLSNPTFCIMSAKIDNICSVPIVFLSNLGYNLVSFMKCTKRWDGAGLEELKKRILTQGRVLPGNILKVDGFLNHQVDVSLMEAVGEEFHRLFSGKAVTKILTIEASGIPLAFAAAKAFNVPFVFAKKAKSDNIDSSVYTSHVHSYTYRTGYTITVSKQYLHSDDKVLIIDDFLANGQALNGLIDIVHQAGATLVGAGVAIEKGFQSGGRALRENGVDVKALATIEAFDGDRVVLKAE